MGATSLGNDMTRLTLVSRIVRFLDRTLATGRKDPHPRFALPLRRER
jgi:hypothetical protein